MLLQGKYDNASQKWLTINATARNPIWATARGGLTPFLREKIFSHNISRFVWSDPMPKSAAKTSLRMSPLLRDLLEFLVSYVRRLTPFDALPAIAEEVPSPEKLLPACVVKDDG
jgi:hypothetical protein